MRHTKQIKESGIDLDTKLGVYVRLGYSQWDSPVDEVHGHVQSILRVACKSEVLLEYERQDTTPVQFDRGGIRSPAIRAQCWRMVQHKRGLSCHL